MPTLLELDEFQQPEFQGYVENVPPARQYLLAPFLPEKQISDIKFSWNVINGVYAQAASITAFNAAAPLRDKQQIAKHFGELAKVQHGFRVDEEELLRFTRPRSDDEVQQAIEYIYNNTDRLVYGVQDIVEFMRAQAVYNGKLVYDDGTDPNNPLHLNVDFGVPSENKLTATSSWTSVSDATPLDDIITAVKQYQAANNRQKPAIMHMTSATEAVLLQNEQIKNQVYGNPTDKRLLTQQDLHNTFVALGLPDYTVNDDVVNLNGTTTVPLLDDYKVVLLGANLGQTMIGPTAEKNYQPGIYVVTEIRQTNPPSQSVFVGETAFPAIERPQSIVQLNVNPNP
jgi:hypothetical protein